jgi:hypothetical protein
MEFGFFSVAHIEIPIFEIECPSQFLEIKKSRHAVSLNHLLTTTNTAAVKPSVLDSVSVAELFGYIAHVCTYICTCPHSTVHGKKQRIKTVSGDHVDSAPLFIGDNTDSYSYENLYCRDVYSLIGRLYHLYAGEVVFRVEFYI